MEANSLLDCLIIGSGLTGATIARILTDCGLKVLIIERGEHVGGNVYDEYHSSGILYHTYGPHLFRTSSEKIWNFVNRFTDFFQYEYAVSSWFENSYVPWPITEQYIQEQCGLNWKASFKGEPRNFEEAVLSRFPAKVYQQLIKGYTEKQWGVTASSLSAGLADRITVNKGNTRRFTKHKYQGLPSNGYHQMMNNMLKDIPLIRGVDYLECKDQFSAKQVIYTGPIDEYFGFDLGRLEYRGQKRVHVYYQDKNYVSPTAQVNYPSIKDGLLVRTIEWKHLMNPKQMEAVFGTLLTSETPFSPKDPNEFEYPFPSEANQVLYKAYRERAESLENTLVCGRLGEYRYYDMDQAIGRALALTARKILTKFGLYNYESVLLDQADL